MPSARFGVPASVSAIEAMCWSWFNAFSAAATSAAESRMSKPPETASSEAWLPRNAATETTGVRVKIAALLVPVLSAASVSLATMSFAPWRKVTDVDHDPLLSAAVPIATPLS